MIVDAGGYSIDITIYQIIDNDGTMKQLISTESYKLGILNITDKIIKIIEDIFGKRKIDNARNKDPGEWVKTLNDINNAIENINYIDGMEVFEITGRFGSKNNYYDYENNKKYRITYDKFNIKFPGALIGKLIFENVNIIKEKIGEIIQNMKLKKIKLNSIIITGGFSQNKIFQNEFETNFKNVNYLSSYYRVISKGAVLYGIHPNMIKSRVSPVTIGVGYSNNEKNEIILLVRKGEEMKKNLLFKIIKLHEKEVDYVNINIFISNEDFKNFELLKKNIEGKIVLKLDKDNKSDIHLKIYYETIVRFSCNYENGKEIDAYFEFNH
jgi:molecular chaperone DnaK (HSP70)